MTLKIGTLRFDSPLIQAPLAGYSCAPMRKLAHQYGGLAYSCTEMLSAQHIFSGARQKKRYTYKDPDEGLLCFQLSGNQPDVIAHACEQSITWGADLIDLNCGCPQPKIRKKKVGSQLLNEPEKLYQLVRAMKRAVDVPVTVKIRVDGHTTDNNNHAVLDAVESGGADALIIHGRHWTERYDTPIHIDQIQSICKKASIPVIANGDVDSSHAAKALMEYTGASGIMIARASLGQPWLFQAIRSESTNKTFKIPSHAKMGEDFLQHVKELILLEGEYPAILQSRKLVKYYLGRDPSITLSPEWHHITNLHQVEMLIRPHVHLQHTIT